ncbi:MAG: TMEM175 family protein [Devosia sp.]
MAEDYTTARMVTLTDGVLSIAMTLLVLDIRLAGPADNLSNGDLWAQIVAIKPQLSSYGLSFIVIAIFWISHVQKFRHLARMTNLMVWLNILFLLGIGIVPFTTALLAENGNAVATAVYAVGMAFASIMLASMSIHVRLAGLVKDGTPPRQMHTILITPFGTAAIFLISAGVAFINAEWAKYLWLLLIPMGFVRERREGALDPKDG